MFDFSETWLVLLALGIGALHMLVPDHWVPLTVFCHSRNFSVRRSATIAAAGGLAHVGGSLLAMLLAVGIGIAFAAKFSSIAGEAIGASFLLVALWMALSGLRSRPEEEKVDVSKGAKWLVFMTASTPELTVFPVYLAAGVYGFPGITLSLLAFTFGTVASVILVTIAGMKGMGLFLRAPGRERQLDYAMAAVLAALGLFVLAGG